MEEVAQKEEAAAWRPGMEAQATPQIRRAKKMSSGPGRCSPSYRSRRCWTASYSPLPPRLASRGRPRRHTLTGPPLPPSQATAPTGTDPQDARAREFRRSSPRLPAAQPSGICSSCPRRHRGTRSLPIPKSPAHRWLGRPGHRAYWERESQLSNDMVNETIIWTTFPDVLRDGQDPEVRA